jgi:hypothetical protein
MLYIYICVYVHLYRSMDSMEWQIQEKPVVGGMNGANYINGSLGEHILYEQNMNLDFCIF